MPSPHSLAAASSTLGLVVVLAACAPAAGDGDAGYQSAIAAVVAAETDASGRAFEMEVDDGVARVRVAVGSREVEVDVDLSGPTVSDRREDGDLDADDRGALDGAATSLADAIRIAAAAHAGDQSVDEVDLQNQKDAAAWRVEFADGGEVAVAVADGSIERTDD